MFPEAWFTRSTATLFRIETFQANCAAAQLRLGLQNYFLHGGGQHLRDGELLKVFELEALAAETVAIAREIKSFQTYILGPKRKGTMS